MPALSSSRRSVTPCVSSSTSPPGSEPSSHHLEQPQRIPDPMDDSAAKDQIELLPERIEVVRVESRVDDVRVEQLGDRLEPCAALALESRIGSGPTRRTARCRPPRHDGAPGFGEKRVEAIESADVQDARPRRSASAPGRGSVIPAIPACRSRAPAQRVKPHRNPSLTPAPAGIRTIGKRSATSRSASVGGRIRS